MAIKDSLLANETIVRETKKHWFAPVRDSFIPIAMILIGLFLGVIAPQGDGVFGAIGNLMDYIRIGLIVIAVAWMIYNVIVWRTAEFAITTQRVLRDEGIFSKRQSATMLSSVTDVNSDVGMIGRTLGYGDLRIYTQSGKSGEDIFNTIVAPLEFRNQIMERKIEAMSGGPAGPASMPAAAAVAPAPTTPTAPAPAAAPAPSAVESADALSRLADLHDRGAITDEEFEAKKAEILGRM
jgi:membrane protein YdbS with pleckstrin-like domain